MLCRQILYIIQYLLIFVPAARIELALTVYETVVLPLNYAGEPPPELESGPQGFAGLCSSN
ncbi:putative orfan [Tupanvirus soda lake]|uniref:Orfan n=2 Tax=Tupanvirus TaxID=2094720 RepID=A0AC62AAV7_9VIRU|nr:putative orfan [Tupanvirus soda lake]QKU34763.1 putative orfan [Tupanvirus soda lake]